MRIITINKISLFYSMMILWPEDYTHIRTHIHRYRQIYILKKEPPFLVGYSEDRRTDKSGENSSMNFRLNTILSLLTIFITLLKLQSDFFA